MKWDELTLWRYILLHSSEFILKMEAKYSSIFPYDAIMK
jgi:hypothetical protein